MAAFKVVYTCPNCNNEWAEEYEKGDVVEEKWDGIFVDDHRCERKISCKFCHRIKCPVCGLDGFLSNSHPHIKEREIIGGLIGN